MLVGREGELQVLRRSLDRLARGDGGVVLVEGDAGIGKTRLLEEALAEASARDLPALLGRGAELERDLPFAALADALERHGAGAEPLWTTMRQVVSGERGRGESEAEYRVRTLHVLTELFERACERRPMVVTIDDLQWADRATLLLLERLARGGPHLPLLLLLGRRTRPARPMAQAFLASLEQSMPERLLLGPLDEAEVRQLVERSLGAAPGTALLGAVAPAAGNPLFVKEVLATLEREGALETASGVVEAHPAESDRSLSATILRRVGFLSRRCRELLDLAALLGSELDVRELSAVAAVPAVELAPLLEDAIDARVLRTAGTRLAFSHDLVREAIYKRRSLAIRGALHYEVARTLRDAGYPATKVAAHLLRGVGDPDPEAIGMLRRVARECGAHDPLSAVELLERAAALTAPGDASAAEVKAELARGLIWAGRWTEGERLARELDEVERQPAVSRDVLEALASASALRGAVSEPVARQLDTAAHAEGLDTAERARLLTAAGHAAWLRGELARAGTLAREGVEAARLAGDQFRLYQGLHILSSVAWHRGQPADGLAAAEQAVALARDLSPDLGADAQGAFIMLGLNLALLGRQTEAVQALVEGAQQAERSGNVWAQGHLHQMLGVSLFYAGDLAAAEGEFEASLAVWEEAEARWAIIQEAWLGRIAVHRGDFATARRRLDRVDAELPTGSVWTPSNNVVVAALARALLSEAEGDRAGAFMELEAARGAIVAAGAAYFALRMGPEHVRLAMACGETGPATEMTAAVEAVGDAIGAPAARGQSLRCRGLLLADAATLVEAVAAHREGASRIELAGAAEEAAGALARSGAVVEARALLYEALEVWEQAGAAHDSGRVLARIRELGGRPGKRGPRRRATTGWGSLTDSERRVIDLVREGLTYREVGERLFISRRTVETHVARAFGKLGIRSRAELAALVTGDRGAPPDARAPAPGPDT